MFMLSSCRCRLSSLRSVIHSSGFLVMSSSSHLANFLSRFFLEDPIVGSNFIESFVYASPVSLYLLAFVFYSSTI